MSKKSDVCACAVAVNSFDSLMRTTNAPTLPAHSECPVDVAHAYCFDFLSWPRPKFKEGTSVLRPDCPGERPLGRRRPRPHNKGECSQGVHGFRHLGDPRYG